MSLIIMNAVTNRRWFSAASDWPIRIHGQTKSGASLFTIVLTAELIRRGERVVFLCAHGDAIRAVQSELELKKPDQKYQVISKPAVEALESSQLITLFRRPRFDLLQALRSLADWGERIVIVKNAEELLTPLLWEVLRSHRRLILSGNFDGIPETMAPDVSGAAILFSPAPKHWPMHRTDQPRYVGECVRQQTRELLIISDAGTAAAPLTSAGSA